MALAARVVLFTVIVPVAAPMFSVVAAPPKFSVVAPVFTKANVVDAVVRLVVIAGDVPNTKAPEPVSPVTAAAKFAEDGVPRNVATPVPRPLTPVEIGKPVALVKVPEDGVPKAGVTSVGLVDKTTAPVPVAVLKSVRPASQLAAVVPVMRIQVHIVVVPGKTVMTKFPPEELTVRLPVLLLTR